MSLIGKMALIGMRQYNRMKYGLKVKHWTNEALSLFYLESGFPGNGPTLVFLHGLGASKDQWGPHIYDLARKYHCVFLDLPGEGESSYNKDEHYGPVHQVERLNSFFQALELKDLVLVGASIGGCIGILYAAAYKDKVQKLVAIAPAGLPSSKQSSVMNTFLKTGVHPFGYRNIEEMSAFWNLVFYQAPQVPNIIAQALADKGRRNFVKVDKIVRDFHDQGLFVLDETLQDLQADTLVLWGDQDRIFDVSCIESVKQLLPIAKISVIKNAGHVPYLEAGPEIVQEVVRFLESA